MNGTFAREALRYHHAGLNVLPVVLGSKHPPVGLTWRRWQVHHQTEAEVGQLIEAHPSADVALITGGPSHLVDVETDSRAGEGALRELRLPVPATACFTSPRGAHRLYRALHPLPSRIGFRPGLDVLAARRYVLVPRSTGREWLTPGGIEAVAPLPEAWESILGGDGEQRTGEALRQVENEGVEEGRRDDTLAALVGRWLTQGMPEAEIRRRACAWARRCTAMTHPFDEAQAEKVVRSIICARERIRSPEGKALLRARDFGLHPAERFVLVGLETLRTELGVPQGHEFAAPTRLVATLAGLTFGTVSRVYRRLEQRGLIHLRAGHDPDGRPVSLVTLCNTSSPEAVGFLVGNCQHRCTGQHKQ